LGIGHAGGSEANQMVVYYWVKNEPHTAGISARSVWVSTATEDMKAVNYYGI
jgi:hypothetical protein